MNQARKKIWLSCVVVLLVGTLLFESMACRHTLTTTGKTRLWHVSNVPELRQAIAELKLLGVGTQKTFDMICRFGGTIILAPGTYALEETIEFQNVPQVNLVGSGWNTIWQKEGPGDAIRFIDCPFSAVRNMKIVGDPCAAEGSGIIFRKQGSSSCTVDYCRIREFAQSGIRFEGTAQLPLSTNTVSNCHFIGNREDQLYSFNNNDFYIMGNQFGTHTATPQTGAVLDHSSAGTYTRNYHWSNTVAFKMKAAHFNRIENNRFEMSEKEGIIIGEPNGELSMFNIFTGNTIHTNSMSLLGGFTAVVAYNATDITFCQNQIFSWNSQQTLMKRGLEVNQGCSNWIIKDNIFRQCKEKPALLYDPNAGHVVKDNLM